MARDFSGAGDTIRAAWSHLSGLPGGKRMFSLLIGQLAPYSGSVGAVVQELGPGRSVVTMNDRRKVRNHLNSVHAIALINVAEISSGLALMYGMPDDARGILVGFNIEYVKKARGVITAECQFDPPTDGTERTLDVPVTLYNQDRDVVATATANWRLGPKKRG